MCGPAGACDPRDFDEPTPTPAPKPLTIKDIDKAAIDILKTIVDMNPEEMLTQTWVAERSGNTVEHLKECVAALTKRYTEYLDQSGNVQILFPRDLKRIELAIISNMIGSDAVAELAEIAGRLANKGVSPLDILKKYESSEE